MRNPNFRSRICAAALAVGSLATAAAQATSYSNIYFFGDSVSDDGNVALAIGFPNGVTLGVSGNSYIPDYPYYPSGRFSNGPVWAEGYAAKLGVSVQPSLRGGNDFAWAGARTGGADVPVPTLTTQANTLLTALRGVAPPDALYVVAEVGNDARDALAAIASGADVNQAIRSASAAYAKNVGNIVATLRRAGARHFLVFDNVNLGLVPAIRSQGAAVSALATALTSSMNQALFDRLDEEAGVRIFDTFSFVTRVVRHPADYGFVNATAACGAQAGADCSKYVFWDGLHPTAQMHELIATVACRRQHGQGPAACGGPPGLPLDE
jgi:outer membrane lipase/esterase